MTRTIVWEGDTAFGHYQVVDTVYDGRPARVLYSGDAQAAQSGVATDERPELLFDYNQRFREITEGFKPKTVLIIGGGTGTYAKALLSLPSISKIDILEPDLGVIKLAYNFFGLPVDNHLRINATDGLSFLKSNISKYDIVILDAFHHMAIPAELKTAEAFKYYRKAVSRDGTFCANIISTYHGPAASTLKAMVKNAQGEFDHVELFRASAGYSLWLPQNFVLVAQIGTDKHPQEYTRGIPIDLP